MPSKSAKQRRFMAAAANNPEFARKADIPQSVAKEYHAADKKAMANGGLGAVAQARGGRVPMFYGGVMRALEKAQDIPGKRAAGEPFKDEGIGKKTRRRLAKDGWTLAGGMWYPPQGTLGFQVGAGLPAYEIPRAPQGPITPDMMEEGSIAREIYDKYGIIDPTATRYDLTSQERMRQDPLAHLEADDPARQQYEQWTAQREAVAPTTPREMVSPYPEPSEMRRASPYRQQLRGHKQRIAEILAAGDEGEAEGGPVSGRTEYAMGGLLTVMQNPEERGKLRRRRGYGMRPVIPQLDKGGNEAQMREGIDEAPGFQVGGLAAFRDRRMRAPGSSMARGMRGQRGRMGRGMPTGGARPMNPQMMEALKRRRMMPAGGMQSMMGSSQGRMRPPMGAPGSMRQIGRMGPVGGAGMARPGVMPGRQMVGGGMQGGPRVPPNMQGYLQKMRMMNRPGGMGMQRKQVGMGDQQGGLSRAMQTQTGRPPISRRAAFPGSRQNMF